MPMETVRLAAALVCTFLPVLLTGVAMYALALVDPALPTWLRGPTLPLTVYSLCSAVAVALVYAVLGRARLRALGVVLRVSRDRVWLAVGAFVAGVALFAVVDAALRALGMETIRGMPSALDVRQAALLVLTVGLAVPLCEEILFRAVWYGGLRPRVGRWAAGALAVAAFAAIHLPYFGSGGVAFIALWTLLPLGLYARSGDVTAGWLMHALNNVFAYVVAPLFALQDALSRGS
jgi:membrane protease YdiL (CAAX protease family)